MISDETFDFDAFCKWYRIEKYPQRKFNYGLFLYPDMIAEFRDIQDKGEETDTYLDTSTMMKESESHKKGVQETKEFLKRLLEKENQQ